MAYKNRVILGGNLTKDPEIRTTRGGTKVTEFGLAVTRPRAKASQGKDNAPDYFTVAAFGKLADLIAEHKKKGHAVVVEGEVSYSSWEAQDGSRRSRTTVKADDVQFVDTVGNGINRVVLIGNITRNPESRTVETGSESGVPVCNFGLAINRVRSAVEDAVDFFDVDVWRESAEAVQANKKKGEGVMVEGRLRYDAWEAPDGSGARRSKVKVVADSVQFTTSKKGVVTHPSGVPSGVPASGNARTHRSSASGSGNGSAKAAYGSRASGEANGAGVLATKAQIQRLEREAVAAAGDDGVAKLERRLGKSLSDLTKTEASGHIDSFVQAKSVPA